MRDLLAQATFEALRVGLFFGVGAALVLGALRFR